MPEPLTIAIVDDDIEMLRMLSKLLSRIGYTAETFHQPDAAIAAFQAAEFAAVITDIKMPALSGMEVLQAVRRHSPATPVIIITAFGTVTSAVEAMRQGAFDYVSKPFNLDELMVVVGKAMEQYKLQKEISSLRRQIQTRYSFSNILGKSAQMQKIFDTIERVANTRTSVLIQGKTGTGKELIARAIHFNSNRRQQPFMAVNCGAIPDTLLESELFGHEKGAYTGAVTREAGLLVKADQGTIFLDEIGDMSLQMQAKLLRVLEDWEIRPVGGTATTRVDVRVVAATNKALDEEVTAGRFREDLYYRINVITITVPELRERTEDLPLLINHFLRAFAQKNGSPSPELTKSALNALLHYGWPGNVRELENVIEHAMLLSDNRVIDLQHLPAHVAENRNGRAGQGTPATNVTLEQLEREYILKVLTDVRWHRSKAAAILGIDRRTLYRKIQEYALTE